MNAATQQLALLEALGSSLDLRLALDQAYPLLLQLVSADYAALGVADPQEPRSFDWIDINLPPSFFGSYAEIAEHDFVRDAVAARPGVVLTDEHMISRSALKEHPIYLRAQALGARMEQVLAVMLSVDGAVVGGLALYRERRTPFGERERMQLQQVTRALANTVRNCGAHQRLALAQLAAEAVADSHPPAAMLVTAPARELWRSPRTTAVLETWFTMSERLGGSIPAPIVEALAPFANAQCLFGAPPKAWTRVRGDELLQVSFTLTATTPHGRSWLVSFSVSRRPAWYWTLTPRELQVLHLVWEAHDNQLIADELLCSKETVKKHVSSILAKSGFERREMLIASKHFV